MRENADAVLESKREGCEQWIMAWGRGMRRMRTDRSGLLVVFSSWSWQ